MLCAYSVLVMLGEHTVIGPMVLKELFIEDKSCRVLIRQSLDRP
jgi:hypothetical protein